MISNIKSLQLDSDEVNGTGKVTVHFEDENGIRKDYVAYNGGIEIANIVYDSFGTVMKEKKEDKPKKVIHKEITCCGDCPFCIPFGNPFKYLCVEKRIIFVGDTWTIHKDCPLEDAK